MSSSIYNKKPRSIGRYIIDLIIISEALLISMSYILPINLTRYLLFSIVGLSGILGFLLKMPISSPLNRKIIYSYIILIVSAFLYSYFLRNSLPSVIIFITGVMFLVYLYFNGLDRKNLRLLIICNIFLAIVHIFEFQKTELFNSTSEYLIAAYQNPNMTGIVISSSIFILVMGLYLVKRKLTKLFLVILISISSYLLLSTFNRGSILAMIVFFSLIFYIKKENKNIKKIRFLILIFPFLFIFIYSGLLFTISPESTILGKSIFSGREFLWKYLIEKIISNPLNIYQLPVGGLNYMIAVLIEYGIIALVLYVYLIFSLEPRFYYNVKTKYQHVAYAAFICVFIQQTFESTLINGAYGIYIYSYSLLGAAFSKFDNSI